MKTYICDICGEGPFPNGQVLGGHKKGHTGNREHTANTFVKAIDTIAESLPPGASITIVASRPAP